MKHQKLQTVSNFRILLCVIVIPFLQSCSPEVAEETPWHGIYRSIRYQPDGGDFVITNGQRRFNRALYGTNTGFRVETGDLPEIGFYLPGMAGNLKFGIGNADSSLWLIEAEQVSTRYRPGSMIYEISDPILGKGLLTLHVLASEKGEGMILKTYSSDADEGTNLFWAYGGATGKSFSRGGDIGADPEDCFYLKPEYCVGNEFDIKGNAFTLYFGSGKGKKRMLGMVPPGGEIRVSDVDRQEFPGELFQSERIKDGVFSGKLELKNEQDMYFLISRPGPRIISGRGKKLEYKNAPILFAEAEEARKKLASRIKINTPDPYLNNVGGALGVAADAVWEAPSYIHGSVAWRTRLNGWSGAYIGDWLGWHDRARSHFDGYCNAQYTSPESGPSVPDPKTNLSRQQEKAGNAIFTSGYISRTPNRISKPHHYDMNLIFIDQLLWHFNWTGDLDYARKVWPVIKRHLAWEKRCFDMDGNGLYDAYCCIWASDALYYNGGEVTHSSAYNYRGNLLAARIAEMIGEDPGPYKKEAERIKAAVNSTLWMPDLGWYAEYKDRLGLQLIHPSAALWTVYHALDAADLSDPFQAYQSLRYVDENIPHIPMIAEGMPDGNYYSLSVSNWMPYSWSINNVALSEGMHASLAYWHGGRPEEAFTIWKSMIMESMYLGASPGNLQQLTFYDAYRGETYRDFADPIAMTSRSMIEGLFGIVPDALDKTLTIRPGFPQEWEYASLETPDVNFDFKRKGNTDTYTIIPSFPSDMDLKLRIRARKTKPGTVLVNGVETSWKNLDEAVGAPEIEIATGYAQKLIIKIEWEGKKPAKSELNDFAARGDWIDVDFGRASVLEIYDPQNAAGDKKISGNTASFKVTGLTGHRTIFAKLRQDELSWWAPVDFEITEPVEFISSADSIKNELKFRLRNNTLNETEGTVRVNNNKLAELGITGGGFSEELSVSPKRLFPGSNQVEFQAGGKVFRQNLVNWNIDADPETNWETVDLSEYHNDLVTNIFLNKYLSPRSESPTLALPIQGIGNWCYYNKTALIDDSGLRARAASANQIVLDQGIPMRTPGETGVENILFTSRWDNYPNKATIPLKGKASHAYLLMAGSTNHMQSNMANGVVHISYTDGSKETLELVHPDTWWPIEQNYYVDGYAFRIDSPKPPRIDLMTGKQQKGGFVEKTKNSTINVKGGAATVLDLPLDPSKELEGLSLETLCNDVVIGLMSLTLAK
jgi:hypothetical protein